MDEITFTWMDNNATYIGNTFPPIHAHTHQNPQTTEYGKINALVLAHEHRHMHITCMRGCVS